MKIPSIILAGGKSPNPYYGIEPHREETLPTSSVEMMAGDFRNKQLPRLPFSIDHPVIFEHDGKILLCGSDEVSEPNKCYQLDIEGHTWKEHSILHYGRPAASAVTTNTATFLFGGFLSPNSFEYLPKGSSRWIIGKSKIPRSFSKGCAIAVEPDNEILLIGGLMTYRRIVNFSIENHTFDIWPQELNVGRAEHQCILIPGTNKALITGGSYYDEDTDSTEILDLKDKSVEIAAPMNHKRRCHGMGLINVNDRQRITTFGGCNDEEGCLKSVEFYDPLTNNWETSSQVTLREAKANFAYITIKWVNI